MTNPENSAEDQAHIAHAAPARQRKTHGRATLADVARHAGVTAMTVSRTLREPLRVSVQTAERVHAALKATGYAPNKSAGLLASGRSGIVAALVPNIANSIFAETIQGLSDALESQGLELLLAATGYNLKREEDQIRAVLGWAPSALIVTGRHHTEGALALMRRAQQDGTPVIEMWDQSALRPASSPAKKAAGKPAKSLDFIQVGFNHAKAGAAMLAHLQSCGYADVVFVESGIEGDLRAHERREGFVAAARKAKIRTRVLVALPEEPMAAGRKVMQGLIERSDMPQAMAFSNDYFAAGACLQAIESGIQIPRQLGMMGFGDMPIAVQLLGGISTLAVPRYGIGLCTGQRVLKEMGSVTDDTALLASVEPHLVARSTTVLKPGQNS